MPQRHLLAAVLYKDLKKRKRERQKAQHEDGRATDAKQARMRGHITAVCVKSASSSQTHGEQPGENVLLPEQSLHNLNYGPVWQDICTGESREDAECKFARFTILSETGRERLNAPQFWDRDV